jgi:hypothetical protein
MPDPMNRRQLLSAGLSLAAMPALMSLSALASDEAEPVARRYWQGFKAGRSESTAPTPKTILTLTPDEGLIFPIKAGTRLEFDLIYVPPGPSRFRFQGRDYIVRFD